MNEPKTNNRINTLLQWQIVSDDKINRLLLWIILTTLFYSYYGLFTLLTNQERLTDLKNAHDDLAVMIRQFIILRDRYSALILPSGTTRIQAAADVTIFEDAIIPILNEQLKKQEREIQTKGITSQALDVATIKLQRQALNTLGESIKIISVLYNIHRNYHPPIVFYQNGEVNEEFRLAIRKFREAIGTLLSVTSTMELKSGEEELTRDRRATSDLQGLLIGPSEPHLEATYDPVNDLSLLIELENAIMGLKRFAESGKNEDVELCELARDAFSVRPVKERVVLGNRLTESFGPYSILAVYTPLQGQLKFSQYGGLESYERVRRLLSPPFEVQTIPDLIRLQAYSTTVYDQTFDEFHARTLNVPIVNITIDRTVIIMIIPLIVISLFHLTRFYVRRSKELLKEIFQYQPDALKTSDHRNYSPQTYLSVFLLSQDTGAGSFRAVENLSNRVAYFMRFTLWFAPALVSCTFFVNIWKKLLSDLSVATIFLTVASAFISVLMTIEVMLLWKDLGEISKQ